MAAFALMVFTLANVGLPGTSGFVGEFLTLVGTYQVNTIVAAIATTGVILSACYALYLYRRVVFGELTKPALQDITDLDAREWVILVPLILATIFFGFYPLPVFEVTGAAVQNLVQDHAAAMSAYAASGGR